MALIKVNYVDGTTVIHANNLNAIQDEIIANAEDIDDQGQTIALHTTKVAELYDLYQDVGAAVEAVDDRVDGKEDTACLTVNGDQYDLVISSTDAGQVGKIVFYIEE